jgi:hypothetical protein
MENDYLPINDTDEFVGILKCQDDIELSILYKVVEVGVKNEIEGQKCLRQLIRDHKRPLDGKIHNAYYARVLVSEPLVYIKEEMVLRFIKTSIGL